MGTSRWCEEDDGQDDNSDLSLLRARVWRLDEGDNGGEQTWEDLGAKELPSHESQSSNSWKEVVGYQGLG